MSKFTPGPWTVRRFDGDGRPIGIDNRRGSVCTFPRAIGKNSDCLDDTARLIAAAPEMAELLELALSTDHMDEDDPLFIASRDRIRALLARIEGEK